MDNLPIDDTIEFLAAIPIEHKNGLYPLRNWDNIWLGIEKDQIWIKGLSQMQISSVEVKTIIHLKRYYEKDGKIFPINSLLPEQKSPVTKWVTVEEALPINLPDFNHNYFEIKEDIPVRLVPHEEEKTCSAIICKRSTLDKYIQNASKRRLERIKWGIIPETEEVLLIGQPLLPLDGKGFWENGDGFLPIGFNYEIEIAQPIIDQILNANGENYILWYQKDEYMLIPKNHFSELSKSAFNNNYPTSK